MKSLRLFLLAFAATITIGAVAQDSVIPSRLKLQALRVGTGAVPASGNASVTGTLSANIATVTTSATVAGSAICTAANGQCPLTTDASLLTSGTLNNARLPAAISVTSVTTSGAVTTNGSRDLSYSSGNYTGAVVGCTTNPAPIVVWHKIGGIVSLQMSPFSCTSNSLGFNITGAPAAIRGTANSNVQLQHCINNSVNAPGSCEMYMGSNGTITISYLGSTFTNSGTKGLGFSGGQVALTYSSNW